jgi:hypothetical protein
LEYRNGTGTGIEARDLTAPGSLREKLYGFLESRPAGAAADELLDLVFSGRGSEPEFGERFVARLLGGDPNFVYDPDHQRWSLKKNEALALALGIISDFDVAAAAMPAASRQAMRASLENLPLLALACLGFTRLAIAHLEEISKRAVQATDSFKTESSRFLELADRIDRERGPHFWLHMTDRMRGVALGLAHERALEMPLREKIESRRDVLDCVLCGFASEGHRLEKMLHSGEAAEFRSRFIRATGVGPEQGFSYRLKALGAPARQVEITFAGADGYDAPAVVRIGGLEFPAVLGPINGFAAMTFDAPPDQEPEIEVAVWSTTPRPVQVAEILLLR